MVLGFGQQGPLLFNGLSEQISMVPAPKSAQDTNQTKSFELSFVSSSQCLNDYCSARFVPPIFCADVVGRPDSAAL